MTTSAYGGGPPFGQIHRLTPRVSTHNRSAPSAAGCSGSAGTAPSTNAAGGATPAGDVDRRAPDAATLAVESEGTDWAPRVIATLPSDQAEAVMLRIVAGLDVATTAQILGKRPGAVGIATMRGLRRLTTHPQVCGRTAREPAGQV